MPIAATLDSAHPLTQQDVPLSWAIVHLHDVIAEIRNGYASRRHEQQPGDVVHLRPMNISRAGTLILDHVEYAAPRTGTEVLKGDVLFNNTNSRELVGKTALIREDGDWSFSNHLTRLRFPPMINPGFVAFQLHFLWQQGYSRARCTQHVNQASVSSRTLASSFPIVLAPTAEQHRIVTELDMQMQQIASASRTLEQASEKSNRYIDLVLAKACTGTLLLDSKALPLPSIMTASDLLAASSDPNRLIEEQSPAQALVSQTANSVREISLPPGWRWATVAEAGEAKLGRQLSPKYKSGQHPRPYLRVANVFEGHIDTSDVHSMEFSDSEFEVYRLRRGDILLNEGQSPDLVGRPAIFSDELPGACFQNTLIRFRANPFVDSNFALLVFRFFLRSGVFRSIARWSTNIAHLGLSRFTALPFPLPPREVQEQIVADVKLRLHTVTQQRDVIASVQARLDTLTRSLFRRAFSGKLTAQDPIDGQASDTLAAIEEWRQRSAPAKKTRTPRRKLAQENTKVSQERKLLDVLVQNGGQMSPDALFAQSGYKEDNVDRFFKDLREELVQGRIEQVRGSDTESVYLKVVAQ